MAFEIDNIVSYDLSTLKVIDLYDSSNYSASTVPISSIQSVRYLFATVNSINNKATRVLNLQLGKQYTITGTGSIVIDTKTFNAGDTFILEVDTTVSYPTTMSIDETGYFSPVTNFLPSVDPFVQFTPSQCGQATNLIFDDSIFTCTMELYNTTNSAGLVVVSTTTQFIVRGSAGGTITISGVTYRIGEVFTKSTNFTFANATGTNTVCAFLQNGTFYFMTYYYANIVYEKYVRYICGNSCDPNLECNFLSVYTLLHANIINLEKNIAVDLQAMQNNLIQINTNFNFINPFS